MIHAEYNRVQLATIAKVLAGIASSADDDKDTAKSCLAIRCDIGDKSWLSAYNDEFALTIAISCNACCNTYGFEMLRAATFAELVAAMPNDSVTLESIPASAQRKNPVLHVSSGRHASNLVTLPSDQFPTLDKNGTFVASIPVADFSDALRLVMIAVATSQAARPSLKGVTFKRVGTAFSLHAADGLRLATKHLSVVSYAQEPDNMISVVIPARSAHMLVQCASLLAVTGNVDILLGADKNHILFVTERFVLRSQLIDDELPANWSSLMPKYQKRVVMSTDELRSAVRTADIFAVMDSHVIDARIDDGCSELSVSSIGAETGDVMRVAPITSGAGDELGGHKFSLNAKFVLDVLDVVGPGHMVAISMNGPLSHFTLSVEGDNTYRCLIMPVNRGN